MDQSEQQFAENEPEETSESRSPARSLPPEAYGLTPSAIAAVMGQAEAIAAGRKQAKPKRSLEAEWRACGLERRAPDSETDAALSYIKRAAHLLKLRNEGATELVKATPITGINTYARALRAFRTAILEETEQ